MDIKPPKPPKQHYVYLITNTVNDMKYVGYHYGTPDDSYYGSGLLMRKVIDTYGKDKLTKQVLKICRDRKEGLQYEHDLIHKYDTLTPKGYNLMAGKAHTKESKFRMSVAQMMLKHQRIRDHKKTDGRSWNQMLSDFYDEELPNVKKPRL